MISTPVSFATHRRPTMGSLNLYAREEETFGHEDQLVAVLRASMASSSLLPWTFQ